MTLAVRTIFYMVWSAQPSHLVLCPVGIDQAGIEDGEAEEEVNEAITEGEEPAVVFEVTEAEASVVVMVEVEEEEEEGMECLVGSKPSRSSCKMAPHLHVQHANHVYSNPQHQDPKVAKVEDALHPTTEKTVGLGSLKLDEGFPSRPGYGTKGAKVELTANYVELLPPSSMILYRYDIQISPEAAGRKRARVIQLLLQSAELAPHQGNLVTDFRSTLVSKTKLSRDETIIEVHYRSEGEDEPAARATAYQVRVLYTKSFSISELTDYLNSTDLGQSFAGKQELTQALNIFLNHYAKSADNLATVGSTKSFSLHQNAARGDLGSGLEVIRGFFSSVRIATCRILVNINVSHGAFYHAGPLPALMSSYGVRNTIALERFLKSVRVQITHVPEKRNRANEVIPRVKTIFGLARMGDGSGMAHPPRVRQHGAGAKDVEFWLDGEACSSPAAPKAGAKGGAKGKGKGKGKARPESPAASGSGRYISVFEFFRTSTCLNIHPSM